MQFTFLNPAGAVLFVRDDLESGDWTVEEYTVNATFPYNAGKIIERGQRLAFRNPATNTLEVFEVRNVTNIEPEHYQQIIAEHIAVSELSDDHINTQEVTDQTPAQVLATVLTGTLWAVGNVTDTTVSSADISRGSVWQAVCTIQANWNVYITPRVTVNAAGTITGRYLDIAPAQGTWRGVRLSISKNMTDASVVYDDSEVYTALYGYGGSVDKPQTGGDDETEELTFADVVWTATAEHPAKPAGQTYLEDPAATALYGRNGRPRFGYYQNSGIDDAEVLLQKTWESLQQCRKPKISISGTVTEMYRLGYADQPLQLHDTVLVEIAETGELFEKDIIKLRIDLVDPTATTPEIGDYIPNIIYIERDTGENAGGGGGGGRSPGSETNQYNTYAGFDNRTDKYGSMIAMVVGTRNGDQYVKAAEIGLAINESGTPGSYSTTAYINANHVNISATDTAYTLAGDLEHDADGRLVIKNAAGLYVQRNQAVLGVWDRGNLTGGVMVQQINGQSSVKISGDVIDINGSSITISANRIDINGVVSKLLTEQIACVSIHTTGGSNLFDGRTDMDELHISNDLIMGDNVLTYGGNTVTWKTATNWAFTFSQVHNFVYRSNGQDYTTSGYIVGTKSSSTIHYLGY